MIINRKTYRMYCWRRSLSEGDPTVRCVAISCLKKEEETVSQQMCEYCSKSPLCQRVFISVKRPVSPFVSCGTVCEAPPRDRVVGEPRTIEERERWIYGAATLPSGHLLYQCCYEFQDEPLAGCGTDLIFTIESVECSG